jgi:hypothetical protein
MRVTCAYEIPLFVICNGGRLIGGFVNRSGGGGQWQNG